MTKTFTQNDLIRFIYQETSEEEAQEIRRVLTSDPEQHLLYRELLLTTDILDKAKVQPSAETVENILQYAHGLEVKH